MDDKCMSERHCGHLNMNSEDLLTHFIDKVIAFH